MIAAMAIHQLRINLVLPYLLFNLSFPSLNLCYNWGWTTQGSSLIVFLLLMHSLQWYLGFYRLLHLMVLWPRLGEEATIMQFMRPLGKLPIVLSWTIVIHGHLGVNEFRSQYATHDDSCFAHGALACFLNSRRNLWRLYGCLRLACGWILWHVRAVDDGRFRKHICEALFVCYVLQALAVTRAQFTDRHSIINWIAIVVLVILSAAYGSHRFRKGGNLIKVYELPSSGTLQ